MLNHEFAFCMNEVEVMSNMKYVAKCQKRKKTKLLKQKSEEKENEI